MEWKINLSKSTVSRKNKFYLDMKYPPDGAQLDLKMLLNMKAPKSKQDCRSFSGILNYVSSQISRLEQVMGHM